MIELALFNGVTECNYPGYRRKVLGVDVSWWTLTRKRVLRNEGCPIRFFSSLEEGEGKVDSLEEFHYANPFMANGVGMFLYDKTLTPACRAMLAYDSMTDLVIYKAGSLVELTQIAFELEETPRVLTDTGARAFAAIAWALSCREGAMDFAPESLDQVNRASRAKLEKAVSCLPL